MAKKRSAEPETHTVRPGVQVTVLEERERAPHVEDFAPNIMRPEEHEPEQHHGDSLYSAQSKLEGLLTSDEDEPDELGDGALDVLTGENRHGDEADEAEADEDADDVEDEADEDEDSEDADDEADEPRYKIAADGKEHEVTLSEMQRLASAGMNYTRKTQELAAERQAVVQERGQVHELAHRFAQGMEALAMTANQVLTAEQRAQLAEQYASVQRYAADEMQRVREEALQLEGALLVEAIPEWQKPDVAAAEKARLVEYAESIGYTREHIGQVVDHRAMVLLRKAMLYDQLVTTGREVVQSKAKKAGQSLKPGTPQGKPRRNPNAAAIDRLRRTGSATAAAQVLEGLIDF